MDAVSAHAALQRSRPVIFGKNAHQMKNMVAYEESLRQVSPNTLC